MSCWDLSWGPGKQQMSQASQALQASPRCEATTLDAHTNSTETADKTLHSGPKKLDAGHTWQDCPHSAACVSE